MRMNDKKTWQQKSTAIALALFSMTYGSGPVFAAPAANALPTGGQVTTAGVSDGIITSSGSQMTIDQIASGKNHLSLDWATFNIGKDATVNFNQHAADIALNRIGGGASEIFGHLNAGGTVLLINPNGVLFGRGAQVDVGGIVASAMNLNDNELQSFNQGGTFKISGTANDGAKVINAADIKAKGGLVALFAPQVENQGTITNPAGQVELAAGSTAHIDYDGSGKIDLAVDSAAVNASAINAGTIKADGGYVVMTARDASKTLNTVVNNSGVIEAKSLKNVNGSIVLDGGDQGIVEVGGKLDASGDEAGQSAGNIKANGQYTDVTGSLKATGDQKGGLIETSGDALNIDSNAIIDASSINGQGGEWLLDPITVKIEDANSTYDDNKGQWTYTSDGTKNVVSYVNVKTLTDRLNNGTSVTVQATDTNGVSSIEVNSAITKTGNKNAALTLEAQRNITVNKDITASGTGKLDVNLNADTDGDAFGAVVINADIATNGGNFVSGTGTTIDAGTVGTYFGNTDGNGRKITTNGGNITLNGDVALGLNGKSLVLDTTNVTTVGDVKITGNVDSCNSYKAVDANKIKFDDANKAAKGDTKGGSAVGDTYLATITTSLENSLANEQIGGQEKEMLVGGQKKADGKFYWVTGPEGEQNNGYGTAFADSKGNPVNNDTYVGWAKDVTSKDYNQQQKFTEPNGSGNDVAVGWSHASKWDDVSDGNNTVKGYIQETNTENSALTINAGGKVDIGGNIGNSKALSSLTITNTGDVNVGGGVNPVGGVYTGNINVTDSTGKTGIVDIDSTGAVKVGGTINAVQDVKIGQERTAASVEVGGQITSGNANKYVAGTTQIYAHKDITTNGIDANGQVRLVSTDGTYDSVANSKKAPADSGTITLNGKIKTTSFADDAVIISTKGTFVNKTKNTDTDITAAITTGTGMGFDAKGNPVKQTGNWTIYSATPYADTFGENLNSKNSAVWGKTNKDAVKETGNRYVFAYTPTVTVTAAGTKTYGDVATTSNYQLSAKAEDFSNYSKAFQEPTADKLYSGTASVSSRGDVKTATRIDGDKAATDGNKAIYTDVAVSGLTANNDYKLVTDGTLEISKRTLTLSGDAIDVTYGTHYWSDGTTKDNFVDKAEAAYTKTAGAVNDDDKVLSVSHVWTDAYGEPSTNRDGLTKNVGAYSVWADKIAGKDDGTSSHSTAALNADYALSSTLGVNITPKDIHLDITGSGTTAADVTYSDKGTYAAGLVNKDTMDSALVKNDPVMGAMPTASYTVADYRGNSKYGVNVSIGGTKIDAAQGTVVGNYRFTYDGVVTIPTSPSVNPETPKNEYRNTSNLNGNGQYGFAGNRGGVPGVERVAGLTSAQLPFFKVANKMVSAYGTYDVTESPEQVKLTPSAKRLPEPEQAPSQYRSLDADLALTTGNGKFTMSYNGTTLNIYPAEDSAKALLQAGDATNNEEIASKALFTSFNKMGLVLEDLDGVYIHTDATEAEAKA